MIKTIKKGFTIVELLIVIVVIGILAGIVVVSYNGVQNKAKTQAAEVLAKEVRDKAEAFYAEESEYPAYPQLMAGANIVKASGSGWVVDDSKTDAKEIKTTKLSEKSRKATLNPAGITNYAGWATNKDKLSYVLCYDDGNIEMTKTLLAPTKTTTGAAIYYYDYSEKAVTKKPLYAGECNAAAKTKLANLYKK